jgi:murein DD-endopeptidase MepM/ murein hydrolase activator NlpD
MRMTWNRILERVSNVVATAKHIWDELFRERELILRSQGRVHFVPLTRRLQMCAVSIVLAVALWGIGVTLMSTVKSGVIQVKNDEIREARVAYEDLFEEVLRYQKKVAAVTSNLRESQESLLAQIGEVPGSTITSDKSAKKSTADRSAKGKDEKAELRAHLDEIDRKVRGMTETNGLLEGSLAKIKTELKLAGDERDQIIRTRTKLRERVAQLEELLVKSRTESAYMERSLAELTTTLSQSRDENARVVSERDSLQARIDGLEDGVRGANKRAKLAEVDLRKVLSKLERTTGGGEESVSETGEGTVSKASVIGDIDFDGAASDSDLQTSELRRRTVALLQRLDDLHAAQGNVLDRLGERTVKNIEEAEKLIAMTGLELDQVMERATRNVSGQGGPLFEIAGSEELEGLPGSVSIIDTQLTRWAALRSLLNRTPLISPVDFYHMASGFGLRTDPFKKKKAMHYGVDLAGWGGAPVFATAPGKVIFAGRKGQYGKMVEIDHGYGIRTRYGHLRKVLVKRGEEVGHRHEIGLLGSTGRSTGPHVHYEVRFDGKPLNPDKFIKAGRYVFKGQ